MQNFYLAALRQQLVHPQLVCQDLHAFTGRDGTAMKLGGEAQTLRREVCKHLVWREYVRKE